MLRLSAACTAVLTLLLVFASAPAARADWPSRPVTLMTMTAPGSQIDLLTRDVAARLQKDLGQPVIVRNIPGGSHGSIMAIELAACRPDGYVLGISATAAFTYSPHFSRGSGYSLDDFQYITLLGLNQSGVICPQDRPWKTLRDAFEWAKKENKGLSYMYQGTGAAAP
ncbi:MAG: tripartite tricarboxylate transporter substrate-binding protein [Desulfovibrionaceae bacterium]|nr:tripartite tricarboxylate transporter substrate-binding protein [Desulfovibrionaceae bacterium]